MRPSKSSLLPPVKREKHKQSIPRKQSKIFHIELGQNEGPFNTLQTNDSFNHSKFDPYDATTLMSQNFPDSPMSLKKFRGLKSPNREPLSPSSFLGSSRAMSPNSQQGVQSIKKTIKEIEAAILRGHKILKEQAVEQEKIKADIKDITMELIDQNSQVELEVHPQINSVNRRFKERIVWQKEENDQIQKGITAMKREIVNLISQVERSSGRIDGIDEKIGVTSKIPPIQESA